MASFNANLDIKDIEIIPGMGLSLGEILKLMLNYWNPAGSVYKQIKVNLSAALSSANSAELCNILTGNAFAEAMLDAITQLLTAKLAVITSSLGSCTIQCGKSGPSAANVAKTVLNISVKSFSGDGVSFGTLIASVVQEIVCCALQLGIGNAISKINPGRILGKLNERCRKLISSAGSQAGAIVSAASNSGYGLTSPASQAQIDAAVETRNASPSETARAQAVAVSSEAEKIRQEAANKGQILISQINELAVYEKEFVRLLAAPNLSATRIAELQSALQYIREQMASMQASLKAMQLPYAMQAAALDAQAAGIRGGVGVNWKPLAAAAGLAAVGSGMILAAPVVIVGGAIALITGIWRRRTTS
jgi:hypothetical protein